MSRVSNTPAVLGWFILVLGAGAAASPAAAAAPAVETETGQMPPAAAASDTATPPPAQPTTEGLTLVVPAEHSAKGTVYYVLPAQDAQQDAQVRFISKAALEQFEGQSREVIGYVVVAPLPGQAEGPPRLPAGEFHLPVDSIETGIRLRDKHLTEEKWLNAKQHPNIIFRLSGFEDAKLVHVDGDVRTWEGTITGSMEIRGVSRELRVAKARLTFRPASAATRPVAAGDLLAVECDFTVNLRAHGLRHSILGSKVAENIEISQKLYLATVPPAEQGAEKP